MGTAGDKHADLAPGGQQTWFTAPESWEHTAATLASPTVVPVNSTPLETRAVCKGGRPENRLPPHRPPWPQALGSAPATRIRDELRVVVLVPAHQFLRPPLEEVVQCDVGVRAHVNLVLVVPHLQAHQDHTEIELLIKLGGQGSPRSGSGPARATEPSSLPAAGPPAGPAPLDDQGFYPPCPRGSPPPSPGCVQLFYSPAAGTAGRRPSDASSPPARPSAAPTPCPTTSALSVTTYSST